MNKVFLMGRLTRDPEVRYNADSQAFARYTIAVDRITKSDKSTADFVGCVCFGKSAEFAEKYLFKGDKIAVSGQIRTGSYVNKDGIKVYTTDVLVFEHYFCESKAKADNSVPNGFSSVAEGIDSEIPFT